MLDTSVYPPKPATDKGAIKYYGAGSAAVKAAIEHHQPLLGLHGHIHESKGITKIGRTLCINPGSEYGEGILRGSLVILDEKKVVNYQLTSG
jgi:Icc-related predicted phosphoesterase